MSAPLALARYRVTFEAVEPLDLPAYLGSTLRGAFGSAFRRLCCLGRDGESCPAPQLCPYHLIFESAPPRDAEALSTHDGIARPFVIAPPPASATDYPPGSVVSFDLTLVGRAREYLPHFVVTFRDMDRIGRGRRRVKLRRLASVHPLTGATEAVYTAESNLVTPREAVYEGDLKPFWPYLVFGQWTHVGSGTTFGLGGYRMMTEHRWGTGARREGGEFCCREGRADDA